MAAGLAPRLVVEISRAEFEGGLSDHMDTNVHQSSGSRPGAKFTDTDPVGRVTSPGKESREQEGNGLFAGRFAGRCAVVTGGASGLGFLTAKRILEEGGQVCLWDFNADGLEKAARALEGAHPVRVDVGSYQDVSQAARHSKSVLGKVDILVNCAGITGATVPVQEFPVD
ncbi:MAG TPA: SDR family NAD(P)-dependent oxidoreductase, partial [Rhizomicrobium sp.]|nr:SDR family NAD(P)-dependent oxidoreductase [Rhizomicrobium sp.]